MQITKLTNSFISCQIFETPTLDTQVMIGYSQFTKSPSKKSKSTTVKYFSNVFIQPIDIQLLIGNQTSMSLLISNIITSLVEFGKKSSTFITNFLRYPSNTKTKLIEKIFHFVGPTIVPFFLTFQNDNYNTVNYPIYLRF